MAVGLIGLRAVHLAQVAAATKPQALILAGVAGGLAPELKTGDLVADGLMPALPDLTIDYRIAHGHIHTADAIVSTPAEKAKLARPVDTAAPPLAVDMETDFVRNLANSLSIPFLSLRAILDSANEFLDPRFATLIDADGFVRTGRTAAFLLGHPGALPALMRMQQASRLALAHLSGTIVALLASGWPAHLAN